MAVLAAPTNLKARNAGNGAIRLTWDPVTGATAYGLWRTEAASILSEIQTLVVDATGGTFTITYDGQTTAAISANETAVNVQTALEALSNIAVGDVTVARTGSVNAYTYTLTFGGALSYLNLSQITANQGSLTGGAQTATPATTQGGNGTAVSTVLVDADAVGYFDTTGANLTDYYYRMRTENGDGWGAFSGTVHVLRADDSNLIMLDDLPTADPGVTDAIWNNAGTPAKSA